MKKSVLSCVALFIVLALQAQDNRTIETRVADLLARMPVYNRNELLDQMKVMTLLGQEGRSMITSLVVTPGGGDDTRARFAIESYSRYMSEFANADEAEVWEDECIKKIEGEDDPLIAGFFMSQLIYFGKKDASAMAVGYLTDERLCDQALAIIGAARVKGYDIIVGDLLKSEEIPCISGVLNLLASWNPDVAIGEIIRLSENRDPFVRASALKAMSASTSPEALKKLKTAAEKSGYKWEPSGAVTALLDYAANAGGRGDIEILESICSQVIRKSDDNSSVHYKTAALSLLVRYTGLDAMDELTDAFNSPDIRYRLAAIGFASEIPGSVATRRYLNLIESLPPEPRADIIRMLGERGDRVASGRITEIMFSAPGAVRVVAVEALSKLEGKRAVPDIIDFMRSFPYVEDQYAGAVALTLVADANSRQLISDAIKDSPSITRSNLIAVLALGGENIYFNQVADYCSSDDPVTRLIAFESLPQLAGPADTDRLLAMLEDNDDKAETAELQKALAKSILGADDPAKAIAPLISKSEEREIADKIIPVLPMIGGARALKEVENQFETGRAEQRASCFDALTIWPQDDALYSLFNILSSGNKTYEERAFQEYIRRVDESSLPDEQKLLLYRKVLPFSRTAANQINIINKLSSIHTLPALILLGGYLDNPDLSQAAALNLIRVALPAGSNQQGLYGTNVRKFIERAIGIIEGENYASLQSAASEYLNSMPDDVGFVSMFNGTDLSGWQGLVENPVARSRMSRSELEAKQKVADREMSKCWSVKDGAIWFSGEGANLCSVKDYGDFEMLVDWRITKKGDSGIYLRGTPQVQIWDTSRVEVGAQVGSGGLYNNAVNESKPLVVADNPVGDWNSFRILMTGERVSVWLNGILVVDDIVMENYWDRSVPIFPTGAIELQAHGNELAFRDIYVREIESETYNLTPAEMAEGFVSLFNGRNLDNWTGNKDSYIVEDGLLVVKPTEGSGGNLYTEKEYGDFVFRFEFMLTPGANNGLGIRAPLTGDAAYVGMELQILDNTAPIYANLQPYQYHGSVYGVIPAKRGYHKPVGEWNSEEVIVRGTSIRVILNGTIIVDGDIADARDNGTMDHNDHPGLKRETGHIGFLGHGSLLWFRNIRIKELDN